MDYLAQRGWLRHVTKLNVNGKGFTAEIVGRLLRTLPIRSLSINSLDSCNSLFDALSPFPAAPEVIPVVESLNFYRCTLCDEALLQTVERFPKLRSLSLNKSYGFDWKTLDWVHQYVDDIYHYTNSDDWSPRWSDKKRDFYIDPNRPSVDSDDDY